MLSGNYVTTAPGSRQKHGHFAAAGDDDVFDRLQNFLDDMTGTGPLGVAVSGGSDSLGLLLALSQLASGHKLVAFTVDHGLRPDSADEAGRVATLCARIGVIHEILQWQGEKPGTGLQAAARAARYALLGAAARRHRLVGLVTGHTADDQAETISMRRHRSRDDEAPGLAGIPPASLFAGHLWVMRPLLGVSRGAIRAWLAARGQEWIEDPSNADMKFERVRVRQTLAGGTLPDYASVALTRRERCRRVAEVLSAHGRRASPGIFELERGVAANEDICGALEALIDVAGGRGRTMDRRGRALLKQFVSGDGKDRISLGRVILERDRRCFRLWRERRDIARAIVPSGGSVIWDGRFRISNEDPAYPLLVGAGAERGSQPEMHRLVGGGSVRSYGAGEGANGLFTITPLCGRASHIMPVFEFETAQELARLAGAPAFPGCPWPRALKLTGQ